MYKEISWKIKLAHLCNRRLTVVEGGGVQLPSELFKTHSKKSRRTNTR